LAKVEDMEIDREKNLTRTAAWDKREAASIQRVEAVFLPEGGSFLLRDA